MAQQQNFPGGSGSASPTCSTTLNCFIATAAPFNLSSTNSAAQNNTALTALFAASNAATVTGIVGGPKIAPQTAIFTTATTGNVNVTVTKSDTVYVFIQDSNNRTFTVTDSGGSTYAQLGTSVNSSGGGVLQIFRSTIGGTLQSNTVTVAQGGAAESYTVAVVVLPNVLSDSVGTPVTGSSTAPSISQTTTAANSFVLGACNWWNNASITLSSTSGTSLTNSPATAANLGLAMWGTPSASIASVTSAGTLSGTSAWACQSVEVKSGGTSIAYPTVTVQPGFYFYSGGITPTIPTKIVCEQGAWFYYTGSAHAVDIGPAGLAFQTAQRSPPYIIDGCSFTGGKNMTQGIFFQQEVEWGGIRNSFFYNFGNATGYMIAAAGENWDLEIGPQNRFISDDLQPRNVMFTNINQTSNNSFTRFHDNAVWCLQGYQNSGCTAAQAGFGIVLDGAVNRVYHNNIMFMSPAVQFNCTAVANCPSNQIDQNQIEGPSSGAYTVFKFSGTQIGTLITQNTVNMHGTNNSVIGPVGGTDVLTGARINFNTVTNIPIANVFVTQNNVTGQGGNYSYTNNCSIAFTPMIPCALLHTTGGNISQWNADQFPSCTLVAGTCTATLSQNYGVLPRCGGTWNGVGALAGILKVIPTAGAPNTVVVTSSNGADTAGVQLSCSAGDGQ